jgi:hypothetical protein
LDYTPSVQEEINMAPAPDFNTMNETDVREILVRPLIDQLGYRHGTEATVITEKTLRYEKAFLGRKNPKKDPPLVGRADYICEVISYGRWVIEVKSPAETLSQDVVEQAHTYASHPEVAATFFLVTNGRLFRLYETAKLAEPALEWDYKDQDDNLLKVFNVLSPAAFRKRAKLTLVDPGMPLGVGLPSRLRIIGGSVTYDEHKGSHPFLQPDTVNGLSLPVTGGHVFRGEDKRIVSHLRMAKVAAGVQDFNAILGISDDYDFFTAAEYLSADPERPNIFQNWVETKVPLGTPINVIGLPRFPMPLEITSTAFTEAIGYVLDNDFVGTMRIEYKFWFSKVSQQARLLLARQFGAIPDQAEMTGSGRFRVELQSDI